MNIGLLGLDTSHGPAFARILKEAFPQHRVAAAWPGGSPHIPVSGGRVLGFTEDVRELGVPILDTPESVATEADALFILSLDGASHLPLFRAVARPGLRVFIDKPMANSAAEAEAIFRHANSVDCEVFSTSALRFVPPVQAWAPKIRPSAIQNIRLRAPLNPLAGVPRYHFYAIHAVEILVTLLGPDFAGVQRMPSDQAERFAIQWRDGTHAELELTTESGASFDLYIESENNESTELKQLEHSVTPLYQPLLGACLDFFEGGRVPVTVEDSLATLTLLERMTKLARRPY